MWPGYYGPVAGFLVWFPSHKTNIPELSLDICLVEQMQQHLDMAATNGAQIEEKNTGIDLFCKLAAVVNAVE